MNDLRAIAHSLDVLGCMLAVTGLALTIALCAVSNGIRYARQSIDDLRREIRDKD